MLKLLAVVLMLTLVAVLAPGGIAWAGNVEGQIKSVDESGRVVMLEDGTKLTISPTTKVDRNALKPGATVKASFEEKGTERVVTSIQVMPAEKK